MIVVRAVAALVLVLVPVACSSSGSPGASVSSVSSVSSRGTTSSTTTASSSSGTNSPSTAATPDAARLAEAGVLTATDLPGWTMQPQTEEATDKAIEARMEACVGRTPSFAMRNPGRSFTRGAVEIDSSADVATTAADATTDFGTLAGPRGNRCTKQTLQAAFASVGGTIKTFTVDGPQRLTVPGSDRAFSYRFHVVLTAGGRTLTLGGYQLGSQVGAAEISVDDVTQDGAAFPQQRLVELLTAATRRVAAQR